MYFHKTMYDVKVSREIFTTYIQFRYFCCHLPSEYHNLMSEEYIFIISLCIFRNIKVYTAFNRSKTTNIRKISNMYPQSGTIKEKKWHLRH